MGFGLAVLGLMASLLIPATPVSAHRGTSQPADVASAVQDPGKYADHELLNALSHADLLDTWLDTAPVSASAALLDVDGGDSYQQTRDSLITRVLELVDRSASIDERSERLDQAVARIDVLAELLDEFSAGALVATDGTQSSTIRTDVVRTRTELELAIPAERTMGFSLDGIVLIEYQIEWARAEFVRELTALSHSEGTTAELARTRNRISEVLKGLTRIEESVGELVSETAVERGGLVEEQGALRELMATMHRQRMLSSTFVGGLPLVTLDAYVHGASYGSDGCTVDWRLLAGIGRIESRHGTMNDSSVQASGKLTTSIYGPLLDGGATVAEAEAAARQAEEAAAAALEAEAAEVARIEKERAEHFNSLVWGEVPSDDVADDSESAETQGGLEEDNLAAEASIFDPDLWGDQSSTDAQRDTATDDDDDDGDADAESEENEDAVLTGNGFAVIEDTDNGSLDGNSRWDRAVGPMQFIPETWGYWQTDGNGDGWSDPQNLYDAAASAARFLCKLQQSRGSSPDVFVLGYNSSETYVNNVLDVAASFDTITLPTLATD